MLEQPTVVAVFLLPIVYAFSTAIYRLYCHPLRQFPGPRLAALTLWYEFYYDVIRGGQYTFEIARMHEKYGPIIRISPHELHCNDPDFISTLYAVGSRNKRDKYSFLTGQFGNPESVFGTVPHNLHRLRRSALSSFFSKASVAKLEPLIHAKASLLCSQLETHHAGSGSPVSISMAFSCMTTDIVTEYAFAKSDDYLASSDFEPNLHKAIAAATKMGPLMKHFPWLVGLLQAIPASIIEWLNPDMASHLHFQQGLKSQIRSIKRVTSETSSSAQDETTDTDSPGSRRTIFHELVDSPDLPAQEKTTERLWQEGQIIIGAGTETTAWTLSVTLFYILSDPQVHSKLYAELSDHIPQPDEDLPASSTLEHLPATIAEGLRLSYGVSTRLQRIAPTELVYQPQEAQYLQSQSSSTIRRTTTKEAKNPPAHKYIIPANTPVGMTSLLIHHDPAIFPSPAEFRPERWIEEMEEKEDQDAEEGGNAEKKGRRKRLDKYLLSFSKGSRQCLGINLAYAELHIGIAAVIRRFGARIVLSGADFEEDIRCASDYFVPVPKSGKGVRVVIGKKE